MFQLKIDDDFMRAAIDGKTQATISYRFPQLKSCERNISIRTLEKIIFNAWKSAEPGVLFLGYNNKKIR